MFCKNCGTEMPDESKFCAKCGNSTEENVPIVSSSVIPQGVSCPSCKSTNLQTIVESETTGTGGGFSGAKGCLGFLLLGPLGLLCGSCGSKQKISTTNKTFWVCQNCGNKFRNAQEVMQETGRQYKACFGFGIFFIIFTIAIFIVGAAARADVGNSMDFVIIPLEIALSIFTIMLFIFGIKYKKDYDKAKHQHDENQNEDSKNIW